MRHVYVVFFIFTAALAGWFLSHTLFQSDERRILHVLDSCRKSVEKGSVLSLSNHIAADYTDQNGIDKAMLLRWLYDFFRDTKTRNIRFTRIDLSMDNDRAEADIECIIQIDTLSIPSDIATAIPSDSSSMRIGVDLRKNQNRWEIYRTRHP